MNPEKWTYSPRTILRRGEILDTIGEDSPFDQTFGYYAQWVDEGTATLAKGWKGRLIRVRNENTGGVSGYCLDPIDLVAAKLAAGRPKDYDFVDAFLRHGLGKVSDIIERVRLLPDGGSTIRKSEEQIVSWLQGWESRRQQSLEDENARRKTPWTKTP